MIITCPSCGARYAADPNSIGNDGRRVKCTKCGHIWHFTPLSDNENPVYRTPGLPDTLATAENSGSGPRPRKRSVFFWFLFCLTLTAIVLAMARWKDDVITAVPETRGVYEVLTPVAHALREFLGIQQPERQLTRILAFSEVTHRFVSNPDDANAPPVLEVKGTLSSRAKNPVQLPDLTILLYGDDGARVGLWQFPPPTGSLEPDENVLFSATLVPPAGFATVRVGIGIARSVSELVTVQ